MPIFVHYAIAALVLALFVFWFIRSSRNGSFVAKQAPKLGLFTVVVIVVGMLSFLWAAA